MNAAHGASLTAALIALATFACLAAGPVAERHEPSSVSMRLWLDPHGRPLPFADYLQAIEAVVEAVDASPRATG